MQNNEPLYIYAHSSMAGRTFSRGSVKGFYLCIVVLDVKVIIIIFCFKFLNYVQMYERVF